ncbi:uncharacterized protein LOC123335130 isoform X2 [Bubalus bubalis]|uniref:uncharacterized protein LOC123335130 isoform X2 n=1 Tax=Bubalus bubalis TaxID=89462 RepID=UPI001D0F93E6|nr:uncharacterized protein LOC123335130 isoform X2 [Bubalus bubalis]
MLRRRDERHGLAYRGLRWTRLEPERRRDRRAQTRGLGPPLLAAGPRSSFSAHSGPPLGRFRFRFLAESVEENESGSVQSLRGSCRGEGRTVRGGQPGAGEPELQPAPGEMAVGPGLPCTAGSDEAGQQRNKKMDSLLLKTRMPATSHGFQHGGGGAGHGLGEAARVCGAGPSLTHMKGGGPSLEPVRQGPPAPTEPCSDLAQHPIQTGHQHLLAELIRDSPLTYITS